MTTLRISRTARRISLTIMALLVISGVAVESTGSAFAAPVFSTMNDQGGIYWRSAPDWNTPVAQSGNGYYPGTNVTVTCYQLGTTVPGSSNTMWVQASWASGPGTGSGWMNEHFVNDGAPINQAAAGVPPCGTNPQPPTTTPAPAPAPTPAPAPAPAPAPTSPATFPSMNDQSGIFWRSAPGWNSAVRQAGNGFYAGTTVHVSCYQTGTTVPGSSNTMWVQASWVSGPGHGSGWMNEHFVNDGAPMNQAAPGVPACSAAQPQPTNSIAQNAINWAQSKLGQTAWDGYCLNFVYQAYLYGTGIDITVGLPSAASHNTAYTYWTVAPNHHGDRNPPAGALVFWRGASSPTGDGHVGLSEGGGTIISSYDGRRRGIHTFDINSYQQNLYLGWVLNW